MSRADHWCAIFSLFFPGAGPGERYKKARAAMPLFDFSFLQDDTFVESVHTVFNWFRLLNRATNFNARR